MRSELYRVCCCLSSTIHSENVSPNSGFSNKGIGMYAKEGVVDFDEEISTWEIVFVMIGDNGCRRVWTSVNFFWGLGCHSGLK